MQLSKTIITILNIPRLLLHLLAYYFKESIIKEDVKANLKHAQLNYSCTFGFLYLLVFNIEFRNLFYWRIGKLKYIMWYWLWPHPCFTLAKKMDIGAGMVCIHPFATIVNAESIGINFTVRNNVTIGNNARGDRPTIGNNVTVNANSVVVGRIHIGDNTTIGAGAVVTKSVPNNCVVVGNPAYILKENGITVKREL